MEPPINDPNVSESFWDAVSKLLIERWRQEPRTADRVVRDYHRRLSTPGLATSVASGETRLEWLENDGWDEVAREIYYFLCLGLAPDRKAYMAWRMAQDEIDRGKQDRSLLDNIERRAIEASAHANFKVWQAEQKNKQK